MTERFTWSRLAVAGQRPERGPALDVLLLGEAAPVEELPTNAPVVVERNQNVYTNPDTLGPYERIDALGRQGNP